MEKSHEKEKGNSELRKRTRCQTGCQDGGDVVRTFHHSDDNLSFPLQVDTFLALRKSSSDRMGGLSIRSIFIVPVAAAKIITRIYRIPNLLNKTHEASIGGCGVERSAS